MGVILIVALVVHRLHTPKQIWGESRSARDVDEVCDLHHSLFDEVAYAALYVRLIEEVAGEDDLVARRAWVRLVLNASSRRLPEVIPHFAIYVV